MSKSPWKQRKQHETIRRLSYTPLEGGWYRCNQTMQKLRQSQILGHLNNIIGGGSGSIVIRRGSPPKKATGQRHPSKYRQKGR